MKRANFEKIILLYLLEQIYTKVTKNVNFEILANVPPFLRNKKFLGLGNHVREFGSPPYLRLLKTLYIDFSSQKPHRENSLGQSRSRCQIL